MERRQLRYFAAVYEEGSISAASKRLFVAQPSISTAIAQLEDEVGTRLFVRHRHGVTPAPEAKEFYARATKLLGEFKALSGLFRAPAEPVTLNLALMPAINAKWIAAFMKLLIHRIDRLTLRLVMLDEPAEARIVADRLVRKGERFVSLWRERYMLALPPGHPLTAQAKVTFADLDGIKMIERCHCELHDEVSSALARHKVTPDIVARAQNEEWALAMAAAGVGVAIVPEGSVRESEEVIVRPIERFSLVRRLGLAYDQMRPPSAALRAAITLCREARWR